MEHKLILGGAQYLPFARSRIRALRAAGSAYATQRFVLPDAEVAVRIVGEHEFIHITGSGCVHTLDNGVVDVISTGSADPDRWLPGTLYETDLVADYHAAFEPTDPPSDWKVNPNAAGQIAGTLSYQKVFTGKIPYDAQDARSFSPGLIETETGQWESNPEDPQLLAKKVLAVACPPSVFTGRCRLYVQSIYGRPSYSDNRTNTQGHITGAGKALPLPTLNITGLTQAPSILVRSKKRGADGDYSQVLVSTSSGVHLDDDGDHWLVNVHLDHLRIYPLISSACGQAWRKFLRPGEDNPLTDRDRKNLEAFILAECLPDVDAMQTVMLNGNASGYSMGYGWHWNWDGLVADIVASEPVLNEASPFAGRMRSIHQRINLTKVEGTFQAVLTVVEPWKEWAVLRAWWCIAEPNYSNYTLLKSTPKLSELFECDAPFYAFYVGNELQLARVKVELQSPANTRVMSPRFSTLTGFGDPVDLYMTRGMEDGYLEDTSADAPYFEATISCGGLVIGPMPQAKLFTVQRHDVNNKVDEGAWGYGFTGDGVWNNVYISHGVASVSGGLPDTAGPFNSVLYRYNEILRITFDISVRTFRDETNGYATVVVPFHDAEAIYMQGSSEKVRDITGTSGRWATANAALNEFGTAFVMRDGVQPYPSMPGWDWYERFIWAPAGGPWGSRVEVATAPITPSTETTPEFEVGKLVCKAGVFDATFSGQSEFHDNNLDEVGQTYMTWSGAEAGEGAVVLSSGAVPNYGSNGAPVALPAIVGWA